MHTNEFFNYLEGRVTPERQVVLQTAVRVLLAAGIRDVEYYIDQTLTQEDLGDTNALIDTIEETVGGALHSVLRQFGVVLDDETPMAYATDILQGLLAMDNWAEPSRLSQLCEQNESAEAILADLLGEVGMYPSTTYLPYLASVSESLIARIDTLNQGWLAEALPSTEERARAQRRIERFFQAGTAPILSRALSEMLLIGGDYRALMEPYHDAISALDMGPAIQELVAFALVSELEDTALEAAILAECQGWWTDHPSAATQAQAQVRTLLTKVLTP